MKIFVQSIFKCKRCSFVTKTTLKAEKVQQVESSYKLEILKGYLESKEGLEFVRNLQSQFDFLTEEDIQNPLLSENVRKVLFEMDVIEGHLECDSCRLIYPIKDSILDTVDCIEQN